MGEADMIKAAVGAVEKIGAQVMPEDIIKIARQSAFVSAGIAVVSHSVSTVALVINIGVMCSRINTAIGIELPKNKLNSVVSGLLVALGWQYFMRSVTADAIKTFIPGVGDLAVSSVQAYLFAGATYTAAFIYLKSLSQLDDINKDNVATDKIISGIGDFAKSGKGQITEMLAAAKDMFKNIKREDMLAARDEVTAEVENARAEMAADGKDLDEEVNNALNDGFKLNLDKESMQPSKLSKVGGWLKNKFK